MWVEMRIKKSRYEDQASSLERLRVMSTTIGTRVREAESSSDEVAEWADRLVRTTRKKYCDFTPSTLQAALHRTPSLQPANDHDKQSYTKAVTVSGESR